MKSTLSYAFVWLAAVAIAGALATLAPNDRAVMGRVAVLTARGDVAAPALMPHPLAAERTLALITFLPTQRAQADNWIAGLRLSEESSIHWVRMPVLNDPGTSEGRSAAQERLRQRYEADAERARLYPLFTNRADFARNAGLNGTDQFYALVLNQEGDVLARVAGDFDAEKASVLRETLNASKANKKSF
jgi:hypothetical protein